MTLETLQKTRKPKGKSKETHQQRLVNQEHHASQLHAESKPKRTTRRTAPTSRPKETLVVQTATNQIVIHDLERTPMPDRISPMLATLVDKPFSDPNWLFENKWDGVRALCYIDNGTVRLVSRNEKEMTARYPELANIPDSISAHQVILDGEIVVLGENGKPSFHALQARIGLETDEDIKRLAKEHPIVYYVFDLLYYNGFNLMPAPLIQRKNLLQAIMKPSDVFQFSQHVLENGNTIFTQAQAEDREGIVAKHQLSAYVQRRSSRWLKLKTVMRQAVVIGGYTEPRGNRGFFGALVVGLYRDEKLVFVGHVGGGFNRKLLEQLYNLMQPLKTMQSPFNEKPRTNEPVQWLKPELVSEVKFAEWTAYDRMRQPIFLGLRNDKSPKECIRERKHATTEEIEKVAKLGRSEI